MTKTVNLGGRPKGALSKISEKARQLAAETGILPHAWLMKIARGEPVTQMQWVVKYDANGKADGRELVEQQLYADFATRVEAAKAAAPFYAPRLSTQTVFAPEGIKCEITKAKLSKKELVAELKKRGLPTTLLTG